MKRSGIALVATVFVTSLVWVAAPTIAFPSGSSSSGSFDGRQYLAEHGYLPLRGVATLQESKRRAQDQAASQRSPGVTLPSITTSSVGASWRGVAEQDISPPDANGAIGPSSFVEVVNLKMAIYSRTGSSIATAALKKLTGRTNNADPTVLWDPDTQRFYYNVLNVSNAKMDWGFSKSANPSSLPGGFCNYETGFGYSKSSIPDYPKLGQTKGLLLVGVNFYPTNSSSSSSSSDVLWISKPQGTGRVSTCPAATSFAAGKFTGLVNQDGSRAFTPIPAIQTDPSSTGYVVTMSDLECPPNCGSTGTTLTVFKVTQSVATPQLSGPSSMTVGSFMNPPDAPQLETSNTLDTLDGRITHAVSGFDPAVGSTTVWTAHAVLGGAGSEIRWYEVDPTSGSIVQSGAATDPSLYLFDPGISPDRTCSATQCAHGDSMALGFTTSSGTTHPADQMVTKTGGDPQSAFVLVKQSAVSDRGFTCTPCRWGDYGGATADPAADLGALHGEVWLSNQWTTGGSDTVLKKKSGDATWNWEARL